MDHYENALEKLKDLDSKKANVDLDDFEEFMRKVEEVNKMVHALTSSNKSEIEEATQNAAVWLKAQRKEKSKDKELVEEVINNPSGDFNKKKLPINKTVINEKAFAEKREEETPGIFNTDTMSKEAFMKSIEDDAKQRSEDRKKRKIESDALKENAKKAFLLKDYEKALDWYNKAIDVRKDSYALYINRALTLLKLGLYSRALSDCETALKLNETGFKAVLYKGKAYFEMAEEEKAEEWMTEAKNMFPDRKQEIEDYQKSWYNSSEEEEEK